MPVEIGLWRVDGESPMRVKPSGVPLESQLEDYIEADPTLLGEPIMLIGRQVPTGYGTFIDLLGVDSEGGLHVLELKRNKTPREVVAQVLDYGSWVSGQTHDDVLEIYATYKNALAFEQAFAERFGVDPPSEMNSNQTLTVIASDIDPATERIIRYLAGYDVPVNVVLFRYFGDGDRSYLSRAWLLDDEAAAPGPKKSKKAGAKEAWNNYDWYVSFGELPDGRSWDDARKYGFVSAGGGPWFSQTLHSLPVGDRISAYIPKTGYVGVGIVTGPAQRFDSAKVTFEGKEQALSDLPLSGTYVHDPAGDTDETAEYVVPIDWLETRERHKAFWTTGMFANQNSACKLRNKFTLAELAKEFDLTDEPED